MKEVDGEGVAISSGGARGEPGTTGAREMPESKNMAGKLKRLLELRRTDDGGK